MDSYEYERLVGRLIDTIRKRVPTLTDSSIGGGPKCRMTGGSGYRHQIDVAVESRSHIVLVECKHWKTRIGVKEVLVLKSRQADIKDASPGCRVEALFATTVGATLGARRLAKYFEINVGAVSSENEFALRVASYLDIGVADGAKTRDEASAVVFKPGGEWS